MYNKKESLNSLNSGGGKGASAHSSLYNILDIRF